MACGCEVHSSFRRRSIACISLPFVPRGCLLLQRGSSSDRHWWDVQDSHEEVQGRFDSWCPSLTIFPSGSGWVLMYVPQRENKKDFLLGLPIFPQGEKKKLTPVRHLLLAARIHSTVWPKPSLSPPTKIVVSVEEYQPPDHEEFRGTR